MIRMIQSRSAGHAKAYFSEALARSDYYIDGQELNGNIQGKIADRLGISGMATKENFYALCENKDPATGNKLTPRTKEERTTGYDINFHCPKSVSILHALGNDSHILDAFHASVQETMQHIEADSKTRVRKGGKYEERDSGELVWADFIHQTARPVEGHAPDPHLHCHCFVFNVTWDKTEDRLKAGQFRDIKRDMPYYQALFHKEFSDRLINLGYQIRPTEKSFEVVGVPQQAIDLFSKRTDEIGRVAKEKGITDAKELSELGARTRSKKQKGLTMPELKAEWKRQVQDAEIPSQESNFVRFDPQKTKSSLDARGCVNHAILHSFERASVMAERRLLESAYRFSLGDKSVNAKTIAEEFRNDTRIIKVRERTRTMCTTKEVLSEERDMVELAKNGQGKVLPLYENAPEVNLKGQQASAVRHVLTTGHRVSIIRGAAGTGKTTLMKEAISWMEKAGKEVTVVAPTAEASRGVLRQEGYGKADTVALLLKDQKMQEKIKGQVLWVDEAGLLGTKDMKALLQLTTKQNARLILGGDTKQHASVVRGDALRILNTVAGIKTAEVSKIYRQRTVEYKSAVEDLSKADVKSAFEKLDRIGFIKSIDPMKPNAQLVDDYVQTLKTGKTALIISPTHAQGEEVTKEIRKKLRENNLIGKKEISAIRYSNLNLTEAEKSDVRNFKAGQVIQFNQNVQRIKRGSIWNIASIKDDKIQITNAKDEKQFLHIDKCSTFDVYKKSELKLSKGDRIRITRNGFDDTGKRLNNGQKLEVISVTKKGVITLRNEQSHSTYKVSATFGHINHAHCITSHASQGKTVDEVFISQPAETFTATDAKQFYVSVSRGRDKAMIYTDDKEALLHHAAEVAERQSALELINDKSHINIARKLQQEEKTVKLIKEKSGFKVKSAKENDYDRT